jgi:hypothetical protein
MGIGDSDCENETDNSGWYSQTRARGHTGPSFTNPYYKRLVSGPQDHKLYTREQFSTNAELSEFFRDDINLVEQISLYMVETKGVRSVQDASCLNPTIPGDLCNGLTSAQCAVAKNRFRRQVSFDRILINAPSLQSRYTGKFKGVMIGETALFSLGKFSFEFDDVFKEVPVLPLLPIENYLVVE